ncbi:MAG: hypothetical protein ACYC64_12835 [Armatimonadota bacterium]
MNQDEQNLNLLSIFHYILGTIVALGSSIFLIHVGIGVAMIRGAFDGKDAPPQALGWLFVVLGSLAVLFGWTLGILMIVSGKRLQRHVSRTFCLVIAGIECIVTPLGTVLGVFTIIMLMKESIVKLFVESDQP